MGSWGSCDFSALEELSKRMHEISSQAEIDAFFVGCLNSITDGVWRATIERTPPIRTGHLQKGWRRSTVKKWRGTYQAEIYNNVEYAPWVENGHRIVRNGKTVGDVPPRFMLRNSVYDAEKKAPAYLERKQREFLSRLEGRK